MPLYRGLLGNQSVFKLRYCENNERLNPGVGGTVDYNTWSANGLYDPNITGTGHQPMGFDQIMQFYENYCVIGAKIQIQFISADDSYGQVCGLQSTLYTTLSSNVEQLIENGNCKWAISSRNQSSTKKGLVLSMSISPKKLLNMSDYRDNNSLWGTASANPTDQCYFQAFCAPIQAADSQGVRYIVTIDYITIFSSPVQLAQS